MLVNNNIMQPKHATNQLWMPQWEVGGEDKALAGTQRKAAGCQPNKNLQQQFPLQHMHIVI